MLSFYVRVGRSQHNTRREGLKGEITETVTSSVLTAELALVVLMLSPVRCQKGA